MNGLNGNSEDTTLRIRRETKERLENLEFVKKSHSFNDIILELLENHENCSCRRKKG